MVSKCDLAKHYIPSSEYLRIYIYVYILMTLSSRKGS